MIHKPGILVMWLANPISLYPDRNSLDLVMLQQLHTPNSKFNCFELLTIECLATAYSCDPYVSTVMEVVYTINCRLKIVSPAL